MNNSKLISLLLVLAMVLSMVVLPVAAEDATACPVHPEETWTDVAAADWAAGTALTSGHYRLTESVDLTAALTVAAGETVCIDLAGNNITAPGTSSPIRTFYNEGALTVMDSVGTGVISGGAQNAGSGGSSSAANCALGGNVYNAGTFNLYSGTISGGYAYGYKLYAVGRGGNYYGTAESVLNMYGGTIQNGKAYTSSYTFSSDLWVGGGNICSEGTVNISGGTVTGGSSSRTYTSANNNRDLYFYGGNIAMVGGTLNITGGTVTEGDVKPIRDAGSSNYARRSIACGGNIYADGTVITISGGEISNGEAIATLKGTGTDTAAFAKAVYAYGGNLYADGGSLTVTGGTISGGTADILCLNIGVQTADDSVDGCESRGGSIFLANVEATFSNAAITGGTVSRTVDDDDTTYDDYGSALGGNVYCASTATVTFTDCAISDGTATEYKGSGGNIYTLGECTLTDCTVENGAAYYRGGNITNAGNLYLRGFTVLDGGHMLDATYTAGFGGNYYGSGKLYVYDNVEIKNGSAYNGGNIHTATNNGDIYLYGGKVYGGSAENYGDNIRIYSHEKCYLYAENCYMQNFFRSGSVSTVIIGNNVVTGTSPMKYMTGEAAVLSAETSEYTTYETLTDALAAAGTADTVYLAKDVTVEGDVDVYCALDLNGNNLTATGILSIENKDASIEDSAGTGSATGSEVKMHSGNDMLAIDAGNDGVYSFETVTVAQKLAVVEDDDGTVREATMKFFVENAAEDTKLDEAINAGSDVKIRITVTWNDGANTHHFNYNNELVAQYLADWNNKMFTCEISGLDEIGACTITAEVMSGGVVVAAYEAVTE